MATTPLAAKHIEPARAGFALLAAWYISAYLRRPGSYLLLDHVDLAVHEAGHVVFAPLGDTFAIAGGTLLQLFVPAAFVIYFARQAQLYSAAIVLFWLAQSCFNVAVYAADARAQALPLVGGENVIHDWHYLLGGVGWLQHDATVAAAVRALAITVYAIAIVGSLAFSRLTEPLGSDARWRVGGTAETGA